MYMSTTIILDRQGVAEVFGIHPRHPSESGRSSEKTSAMGAQTHQARGKLPPKQRNVYSNSMS